MDFNFYDDIDKYGDTIALLPDGGAPVTYAELVRDAGRLASYMTPRCVVFVLCRNDRESVTAYIAALRNRSVPLLFNNEAVEGLASRLIEEYLPKYIFAPSESSFGKYTEITAFDGYKLLRRDTPEEYRIYEELALLLATSGSTGSPKLVRQSYKNINANARSIAQYLEICKTDRPITTLPMGYTYGLSIINSHLLTGASIVLTDAALTQKRFWTLLRDYNVTTFGGVPYTYEMLKRLRFSHMELPSLRCITQAGGKLPAELSHEFAKICADKEIKFVIMYGQTEATARMSYLPPGMALEKPGSIGIAIPGGQFRLEDDGELIEKPGVPGELVYSGDNVTLGYAECRDDLLKGDENDGVLYTGDIAERDDDGYYYIVGRKSRFIKVFGTRVNLLDLESGLAISGFDCVCAGKDNELKVFTTADNVSEIERYMRDKTSLSRQGYKVYRIEEIPRNSSGKIQYSELNETGSLPCST